MIKQRLHRKNTKIAPLLLTITFAAVIAAFLIGLTSFAATANSTPNIPETVAGPTFYLGCVGNQTVYILPGFHPSNTSNVFYNPHATQDAKRIRAYCDNGNLINATNGQVIPFPNP